jgi:hypothetical protein
LDSGGKPNERAGCFYLRIVGGEWKLRHEKPFFAKTGNENGRTPLLKMKLSEAIDRTEVWKDERTRSSETDLS